MTQKDGIIALLDGEILKYKGVRSFCRVQNNVFYYKNGDGSEWEESNVDILSTDFSVLFIQKPKPKPTKYFMCWWMDKKEPREYGIVVEENAEDIAEHCYLICGKVVSEKDMLKEYWVHNKDGVLLNPED